MKRFKKIVAGALAACLAASTLLIGGCAQSEYTPSLGEAKLSTPSIGEAGTLRVGVNTNNSPLAGKSGNNIIGIDVDIAAALASQLGLKVKVVDVYGDAAGAIDDGDVDIALGIDSTSPAKGYWLSSQYLPTGVALFELASSSKTTPSATSKPKVAAQVSSKSAWAVNNIFGEDCLKSSSDLASAFADLKAGKVDYVASDAVIGLYAAARENVEVKIVALLDTVSGYCAMAKQDKPELQKAVSDALSTIVSNGVVGVIEDKWLGQTVDLSSLPRIEVPKQSANTDPNAENAENPDSSDAAAESSSSAAATA